MLRISLWISTSAGSSMRSPWSILDVAVVLVLFQLALQRAQADAEDVGGAGAMPGGAAEGLEDRLALDLRHAAGLADHRLDRAAGGRQRRGLPDLGRQIGDRDLAGLAEDHHRRHTILEPPHVARPRVPGQPAA